jgi:MFS family permease
LIKEAVRADLRIGDLEFNTLNFWAIVLGAIVVLPVGRLIDRFGSRTALVAVAGALGVSVILMSRVSDRTSFFVTLTLVRGLGQGALSVVSIALVGKWFKRRAGPAMGLFTVLLSLGFTVPIFAVSAAVNDLGWRMAWTWVGYSVLGLVPLGGLLARSSPESCGITPDEDPDPGQASLAPSVTLRTAVRTPAFWAFTLAASIFNLVFSALTLDNELLLTEHGLDGSQANGLVLGVLVFSGLPANIVAGWLAHRRPMGKLLAIGMAAFTGSLMMFPAVHSIGMAAGYATLLGISGGIITVIYFAVYGHTYGRGHLGAIQATVQVLSVLASASGPVALAFCRQMTGGTSLFFAVFAAIGLVLTIWVWIVPAPASRL